jgi:ABC-type Zn uptake system ZnuABC Zn-binding protein ZnuA
VRSRLVALAVGPVALTACASPGAQAGGDGRPLVATTVSPITNLVQNVGGDRVEVTGIVPEGTNSHTFEPAPSDARVMADADIVFLNGLHLEEPTRELAEANARDGVDIVELGEETIGPSDYIFDSVFPENEGDPNPHLWTDPVYAKTYARIILERLGELDPGDAAYFRSNYRKLAGRLDALDRAAREGTRTVPPADRKLLTYHDSFPYFAREYGWEVIGAIQPSDFSDPTAREVADLIRQVRAEGVPAIFGSEVFPSPVLRQIASETGARYIDDLRDDDLPGSPGDENHSYVGLMVFDLGTLVGSLGGDPAPFEGLDTSNVAGDDTAAYR